MNMKKILSLLMAVAMVVSMVVVPAYAAEEYALKLADADGNTTITAEPGSSVVLHLTTDGEYPQYYHSIGGYVSYPDGWTVTKATNEVEKYYLLNDIASNVLFTNANEINPVAVVWTGYLDVGTTSYELDFQGTLSKITLAIPETAQPGTYNITLDTHKNNANYTCQHDENGAITDWNATEVLDIPAINCQIVIPETAAGCPTHGEVTWTEVSTLSGALTTGHYKLTADVAVSADLTVAEGQEVCIDLAGNDITAPSTTGVRVFAVNGALTIMDSVGTGVISGGKFNPAKGSTDVKYFGGNILVSGSSAALNLYGGTITGGDMDTLSYREHMYGGNIAVLEGAVFNMHGGTVSDGNILFDQQATQYHGGGNIYANASTVNISGGTVSGGTIDATYSSSSAASRHSYAAGGNISVTANSVLNITGGVISSGSAIANAKASAATATAAHLSYAYGGNIYASSSTVSISGGEISGGSATADMTTPDKSTYGHVCNAHGGNIYLTSSSLTVTGGTISDGSVATNGNPTSADAKGAFVSSASGASVYANMSTVNVTGGEIAGGSAKAELTSVATTALKHKVLAQGGTINLTESTLTFTGGTVSGGSVEVVATITTLHEDRTVAPQGGNIYVNEESTATIGDTAVLTSGEIKNNLSAARGGNLYVDGEVTIEEGAKITSGVCNTDGARGGNIFVANTLTINGGTIENGAAGWGSNIMSMTGTTITMNGGTVSGGTGSYSVLIQRGTFTMNGGTIENATTDQALSVQGTTASNGGTAYIKGGTVGDLYANRISKVYVSGGEVGEVDNIASTATLEIGAGVITGSNPIKYVTTNEAVLYNGEKYVVYGKLTDALAAAEAADTVTLANDVTVDGDVNIYTTLELNGKALNASGIVSAENNDAVITDSVGTGSATGSDVIMNKNNGMLAIDAENNGVYTYETVTACQKLESDSADVANIKFYIENEADATKLDDAFISEKGVAVENREAYVRITVTSADITGGSHSFKYGAEYLDAYAADWNNKMFTCEITGLSALTSGYTITAEVVSNDVVVAAYEYVPEG